MRVKFAEFEVWGLGIRVEVWGLAGFGSRGPCTAPSIQGLGSGSGFEIWGPELRFEHAGFEIWGLRRA